ncbi:hypothetical protein M3J07_011628 [Ascochyta lentis]
MSFGSRDRARTYVPRIRKPASHARFTRSLTSASRSLSREHIHWFATSWEEEQRVGIPLILSLEVHCTDDQRASLVETV